MMCSSASHDVQREPHGSVPAVGRCAATPSARPQSTIKALGQLQSLAPSKATECTLIVRAQVSTARRACGRALESRCAAAAMDADLARLPRARIKGSSGRQVVSAAALAAKAIGGPQVALGRAGDGPRAFPGWESASVALCGARGGDLRAGDFSAPTPPWAASPRSSA
jgi:hypothetical protein